MAKSILPRNLKDEQFEKWSVIEKSKERRNYWLCRCECGTEREVNAYSLTSGASTSCGCSCGQKGLAHRKTHGLSSRPEYKIWDAMLQRCHNENNKSYHNYGGRGIRVCDHWKSFEIFFKDMGPRPSPQHTIERRNYNGDYCPDNCFWDTVKNQNRNKRNNVIVVLDGKSKVVSDWIADLGISRFLFYKNINSGMPIKEALFNTPKKAAKKGRQPRNSVKLQNL